jgi:hypothetical protein
MSEKSKGMSRDIFLAALQAMCERQPVDLPDLRPRKVKYFLTPRRRRNEWLAAIARNELLQIASTIEPRQRGLLQRLHASTFATMAALSKQLTGVPKSPAEMRQKFAKEVAELGNVWQVLRDQEAVNLQDLDEITLGRKVLRMTRQEYLTHMTSPVFAPTFDKALIVMSHVFGVNFLLFIQTGDNTTVPHCLNRGSPHDIYAIVRLHPDRGFMVLYQRQPPGDEGVPPRIFTWDTLTPLLRQSYVTKCLSSVGIDRAPVEPLEEV